MAKQKVFISWSKEGSVSDILAQKLHEWLPVVINQVKPWLSNKDLELGTRWNSVITGELEDSKFGIFCVTPESQHSSWMLFEAGAISKYAGSRAYVYLIGLKRHEVIAPWNQFQMAEANEGDTRKLVESLNSSLGEDHLEPGLLEKSFGRSWGDLKDALETLAGQTKKRETAGQKPEKSERSELIEKIFILSLEQSKQGASIVTDINAIKNDLLRLGRLGPEMSHVRDGSKPAEGTEKLERYKSLSAALQARGIEFKSVSLANSVYTIHIEGGQFTIPWSMAAKIKNRAVDPKEAERYWLRRKEESFVPEPQA